jgi:hypothetical protein
MITYLKFLKKHKIDGEKEPIGNYFDFHKFILLWLLTISDFVIGEVCGTKNKLWNLFHRCQTLITSSKCHKLLLQSNHIFDQ